MSKESYFAQYVSPNIVIVPTLSFLPPCKDKTGQNTNSGCCEQNSDNNRTSTSEPNSEKNITKEVDCNIASTGSLELAYTRKQDSFPIEEQEKNMNQSIKELSSNKYKSRNNLVDFTGFNIHKRDSSLTKQKDTERQPFKREENAVKYIVNDKCLGSGTHTKNMTSYRELSKSEEVLNVSCEENTKETASNGTKQDKTDMEDKMKRYFRHLWKQNIEKLKETSDKGKQNTQLKSLRTKQNSKDSKREPSQNKSSKSKQVASKRTATKTSTSKTIDTSQYSSRSKSESKNSHSIQGRGGYLSPDSILRYKKFQRFLRHNENGDNNFKTENQNKKDNSRDSAKLLKLNKPTINHAEPKKLVKRKISVKSDVHSNKNLDNKDTMKLVKSVVTQVSKNMPNNYLQDKCDLRSRLSRKRTRSECFTHSQQVLENKMDREDLIITVKQDVKPDPKMLAMLSPKNKPKTKKCKKIKLVINIECPTSDSDDSDQNVNECCTSPQDLSFLDDFDVDEIVDLLNTNHSQAESSTNLSEISQINNTNGNDQSVKNIRETKAKGRLIKATNIKTTKKINKAKTIHYEKLVGDKSHGRDDKDIITDLSLLENNFPNGGKVIIKKTSDKNKEACVTNRKSDNTKDIKPLTESNTNHNKKTKINLRKPDGRIKKPLSNTKNVLNKNVAKTFKPSHINTTKPNDSIEASLETMFNDIEQNISIEADDAHINISKQQANEQKIEDTIEASLDNMFNNIKKETAFNVDTKINKSQHIKQEEIIPTTQQKPEVLVEPHDQKTDNQSKLTINNNKHIKIEPENLQNVKVHILSDTTEKRMKQKPCTKINSEQQNNSNGNIQRRTDNSNDTNKKSLELPNNFTKKSTNANEMRTKHHKLDKQLEKRPQKAKYITKCLEDVKHTKIDKQLNVTSLSMPHKNMNEKTHDAKKSKESNNRSFEKQSDKNIKQIRSLNTDQFGQSAKQSSATENIIAAQYDVDNQIEFQNTCKSNENVKEKEEQQNSNESINVKATIDNDKERFNVKTNIKSLKINKNIREAEHLKKSNHTIKSSVVTPNNNINVVSINSTDTIKKVQEITINTSKLPHNSEQNDKKAENTCHQAKTNVENVIKIQKDFESSNISDKNGKEKVEPLINTTHTVKEQNNAKIDIKTSNKSIINIKNSKEKTMGNIKEKSNIENDSNESNTTVSENLRKDNTRNNCLEATINNTEKTTGNISHKKIETNVNSLQKADCTTEKSLKSIIDTTTNKNAGAETSSLKSIVTARESEPIVEKKDSKTGVKLNTEVKHEKSQEKVISKEPPVTTARKSEAIVEKKDSKTGAKLNTEEKHEKYQVKVNSKELSVTTARKSEAIVEKKDSKTGAKLNTEEKHEKSQVKVNSKEPSVTTARKSEPIVEKKDSKTGDKLITEEKHEKSNEKVNSNEPSVAKARKSEAIVEKKDSKTGAKLNTEEKHEKSQEKVTSNEPPTIDDDLSKTKDTKIKSTEKNNKSNNPEEKTETNINLKQKQVDSIDKIVSNGAEKKQEAKNKVKNKVPSENEPFVKKMEERMMIYLDKQYTVTSLVHSGRFSTIYKCKDVKGENYAVKVMNSIQHKNKGMFLERMLSQLQKYRSIRNSSLLHFINGFGVQGLWCLLANYYPKNLKEALAENKRSFHIELVQVLARQLIDAVNMLTNNNIIHSDIKPTHILLNSDNDRLKLCGFDRANYSNCMNITPSTGTPSYRAPEIILGFSENYKIDVWSTALVIFEMATNITLFPGHFNNDILYKQICTLGSFDWEMMEYCKFRHLHFKGLSFVRQVGCRGEKTVLVDAFHRNKRLRKQLYKSAVSLYHWEDIDSKIEKLHRLLEQMLVLDPRHRLPIQFAAVSEFLQDEFT